MMERNKTEVKNKGEKMKTISIIQIFTQIITLLVSIFLIFYIENKYFKNKHYRIFVYPILLIIAFTLFYSHSLYSAQSSNKIIPYYSDTTEGNSTGIILKVPKLLNDTNVYIHVDEIYYDFSKSKIKSAFLFIEPETHVLKLDVIPGWHSIRVYMDGFLPYEVNILVPKDRIVTFTAGWGISPILNPSTIVFLFVWVSIIAICIFKISKVTNKFLHSFIKRTESKVKTQIAKLGVYTFLVLTSIGLCFSLTIILNRDYSHYQEIEKIVERNITDVKHRSDQIKHLITSNDYSESQKAVLQKKMCNYDLELAHFMVTIGETQIPFSKGIRLYQEIQGFKDKLLKLKSL